MEIFLISPWKATVIYAICIVPFCCIKVNWFTLYAFNTWLLSIKELQRISELRGNIKGSATKSSISKFVTKTWELWTNSQISQAIDNGWYYKGKAIPFWGTFCNRIIENGSKVIISTTFLVLESLDESILI